MGQAMPDLTRIPTLLPQQQAVSLPPGASLASVATTMPAFPPAPASAEEPAAVAQVSTLGLGLAFTGNALISGSLNVAGEFQGNIELLGIGHVTVAESGMVVGDIKARHIAVLGQTAGTLDAAGGRVSLHESASVSGRIRYTHLQVNGADLNAQLERVRPEGDDASSNR